MLGVTKRTLYNWKNHPEQERPSHVPDLKPVTSPSGRKFFREDEIITAISQCWGVRVTPADLRKGQGKGQALVSA